MNTELLTSWQLTGQDDSHLQKLDSGELLQAEAANAWLQLRQLARRDGIELVAVSSYRSFERQAQIWQQKCNGRRPVLNQQQQALNIQQLSGWDKLEAILLYSALPGTSRHHWGTELDVMDQAALPAGYQLQLVPSEYQPGGVFAHLAAWLDRHAAEAGFFLPYRKYCGGVAAEPWHLSYQPLADACLKQLSLDTVRQALLRQPIAEQSLVLSKLPEIFQRYVQTICEPAA